MRLLFFILFTMWTFDYTFFHYFFPTEMFICDCMWHRLDQWWINFTYDLFIIENMEDRETFFELFMNEDMYEIIDKPNLEINNEEDLLSDSFSELGIDLSKYNLQDDKSTMDLFNEFLKATNFDFSKITNLKK